MPEKFVAKISIIIGLLLFLVSAGCTFTGPTYFNKNAHQPDPETGIVSWIDAVNNKDLAASYYLEPDEMRQEVSLQQFILSNENNAFLEPNSSITGYEILNKTSNATSANIRVLIYWQGPVSPNSTKMQTVPLFFNFEEVYQDGEWKVWELPF